ncbi:putative Mads box protein [Melia azedarach]|uniref:Mads box protein n=1 Tax=Melia azedarach TaxID=155640 RepID=A0ACC1YT61_MELAZ|nr:putative Mads box protein [Melia azedarach]
MLPSVKGAVGCLTRRQNCACFLVSHVAVVVSSPASEEIFYSFGHSSVDAVLDAYLNNRVPVDNESDVTSEIALHNEIKALEHELCEKAKNKKEKKRDDEADPGFWWDSEDLGKYETISELQVIVEKLEILQKNAFVRMNDLLSSKLSASGSSAVSVASASNVDHDCEQFNFGDNGNNKKETNKIGIEPEYGPQDVTGKLGGRDSYQANEISIASGSNYAYIDENYVRGVNNIQEAALGAIEQEVTGLEYNTDHDYFRNLLAMDFEIANNESPWCLLNDAIHQNSADCAPHQNYHVNPADQSETISTANEFGQLFSCNNS